MNDKWLALLHTLTGRLLAERQLRHDAESLVEELAAEGWEPDEVAAALAWIERFFAVSGGEQPAPQPGFASRGLRTRSTEELFCVSPGAFGFLLGLENAGVIDAATREEILDRALATCEDEVGEDHIRAISRAVLEARGDDASLTDAPPPERGRLRN